jgi:predicted ATP-dependent Lon-type protease
VSRGALARELSQRLAPSGIRYHLRTLRRQLSGAVSTVPPEVEEAMRQILRERDGRTRDEDVERALAASGIEIPQGERSSAHVMVERILPLVELWFHLGDKSGHQGANRARGRSASSAACRLSGSWGTATVG